MFSYRSVNPLQQIDTMTIRLKVVLILTVLFIGMSSLAIFNASLAIAKVQTDQEIINQRNTARHLAAFRCSLKRQTQCVGYRLELIAK